MAQCLGNLWSDFFGKGLGFELGNCFCKRKFFLLLAPGSALEKFAALVNLENKLKWIGPSHGPVPWKFVAKLFFNRGLISGLILLGKVWTLNVATACGKGPPFSSWTQDQLWKSLLQLWPLRTNLLKWIGPSHGPVPWKFVGKLFFNKGLVSGLILLGKVWALNLAIAFVKGFSFFSWLQDQLWKSLLHLWTLRTNLLKWIGPSHGPVPWKFVAKLFFNRGLISGLILLGKVWTLNVATTCGKGPPFSSWIQDQLWKSLLQLWPLRTNLLKWIGSLMAQCLGNSWRNCFWIRA